MTYEPDQKRRPAVAASGRNPLIALLHPKFSIPIAIVVTLIAAPLTYRAMRVAGLPDIGHPFNLEAAGTVPLAPGENAAEDYAAAARLLLPLPKEVDLDETFEKRLPTIPDATVAWMDSNRAALDAWTAGTEKSACVFIQPHELSIENVLPPAGEIRTFARFARLHAFRLESEGALDDAWTSHRALVRYSRHCGQHGTVMERLIGMSVHSTAAGGIERWSRDPRVTAEQLERALRNLQEDFRMTPPPSETLKVEYFVMVSALESEHLEELLESGSPGFRKGVLFLLNEPLNSRLVARQIYANWLDNIDKPLRDRPATRGRVGLFEQAGTLPAGRFSTEALDTATKRAILVPYLVAPVTSFTTAVEKERAGYQSLVAALAIQIHRLRTGEYPATLQTLVDERILDEVPHDPWSPTGGPIRYRNDGDRVIVWSIGENKIDDGGRVRGLASKVLDLGYEIPPKTPPESPPQESPEATPE